MTTPDTSWGNPFLRNMPMVAIVRQKGVRNTHPVVSDETRSKRVFFRVSNSTVHPAPTQVYELLPRNSPEDGAIGFDRLEPF